MQVGSWEKEKLIRERWRMKSQLRLCHSGLALVKCIFANHGMESLSFLTD